MHRYVLALAVICLLAIGAVVLLRPDPAVELEAALARLEPDAALDRLAEVERRMELTENLRLVQARLALAAGELGTARAAYETLLTSDGDNLQVLDELSELAVIEGQLGEAAALQSRVQALAPNPERRQMLGYWYRLLAESDREIALLEATPPRRLTVPERARLAELYFAAGEIEACREMLFVLSEAGGEDGLRARRQLIELSIEGGDTPAALALALAWNEADPGDAAALEASLTTLVGRGATAEAARLAETAVVAEPGIGAVPARVFLSSGHGALGRQMLQRWLASDPVLDAEDWQLLVQIAERSGEVSALRHALARSEPQDAPPPADLFLQFLRYQGPRALLPFERAMNAETFAALPLLGAAWSSWHRRMPQTYGYLLAATEAPLTDWDREIWMSIAQDLRGTPFYRDLLAGASHDAGIAARLRDSILTPVPTTSPAEAPAPPTD